MVSKKLQEIGLTLPEIPKPVASYVPARRTGNLIFVSGQLPLKDGKLILTGPMDNKNHTLEEAQEAMATCFLNGLAAAQTVSDIDVIQKVIRLAAFVASTPDFTDHHKVANGASELARKIFGENGVHARAAFGVPSLPLGATVELEIIFQL